MKIRPMAPGDLEPAAALCSANGWSGMAAHFAFYLAHPHSQPFVAEVDGAVAGTGVAIGRGPVGWGTTAAGGRLTGFRIPTPWGGSETLQLALPAANRAGLAYLEAEGFSLARPLPRMAGAMA